MTVYRNDPYTGYEGARYQSALAQGLANDAFNGENVLARSAPGLAQQQAQMLPTTSADRKAIPLGTFLLTYFPLAFVAMARESQKANDKHNPGEPMHWSREKSNDHLDCLVRHLMEHDKVDPEDGELHIVKVAWRACAMAQLALEKLKQ